MTQRVSRGGSLRRFLIPVTIMACMAALVAALPLLRGDASDTRTGERAPKTAGPPSITPTARTEVHALARLEPESGIIKVGARQGLRIEQIKVKEGDQVAAGALLAIMEGHVQAEHQIALARTQKKSAEFQRSLGRDKLALEREKLKVEREREDKLENDRLDAQQRVVDLAKRRLQASTDIYKTLGQAAQGKVKYDLDMAYFQAEAESIRAQLDQRELQAAHDLIARRRELEDRRIELDLKQVAEKGPETEVLDRQVELAQVGLDTTRVLAPVAGRVLEVTAHAGELSSGALLFLGDVAQMTAIAEVDQSNVPDVKVGDPAEALILGRKVTGKVTRIGRLVGKNTLASLDPLALQDRRTVAVTIRLDDAALASDYVNMQVEVTIRPQQGGPP